MASPGYLRWMPHLRLRSRALAFRVLTLSMGSAPACEVRSLMPCDAPLKHGKRLEPSLAPCPTQVLCRPRQKPPSGVKEAIDTFSIYTNQGQNQIHLAIWSMPNLVIRQLTINHDEL